MSNQPDQTLYSLRAPPLPPTPVIGILLPPLVSQDLLAPSFVLVEVDVSGRGGDLVVDLGAAEQVEFGIA